ncbi:hypothetical protein ECG_00276 [Echinococcus granulosus]|nr:hypothetical protein ECG_00276 [Echinococcus granulosus]
MQVPQMPLLELEMNRFNIKSILRPRILLHLAPDKSCGNSDTPIALSFDIASLPISINTKSSPPSSSKPVNFSNSSSLVFSRLHPNFWNTAYQTQHLKFPQPKIQLLA